MNRGQISKGQFVRSLGSPRSGRLGDGVILGLTQCQKGHLLQDYRRGTSSAFEKIYLSFRRPVMARMLRIVKDSNLAEELMQEAFLRAFKYRERYDPQYEFSQWIWTIAKNIALDYLSKSRSDPLKDRILQTGVGEPMEIACQRKSAEQVAIQKGERRILYRQLKMLPRLQRRALYLRVAQGYSYEEISLFLNVSLSAVKSLIYRAKESLKESLRRVVLEDPERHLNDMIGQSLNPSL